MHVMKHSGMAVFLAVTGCAAAARPAHELHFVDTARSVSACSWYENRLRTPVGPDDVWADSSLCLFLDHHVAVVHPGGQGRTWGHQDGAARDHIGKRVEVFCAVLGGSVCTLGENEKYFFREVR